jgi:hypothetical protein
MAVQMNYSTYHSDALAGMSADGQLSNYISKNNVGDVTIPYGKGVVTSGEQGSTLPVAESTAAQFNGVVLRETNRAYKDGEVFWGSCWSRYDCNH